jgi:hypothetical protein
MKDEQDLSTGANNTAFALAATFAREDTDSDEMEFITNWVHELEGMMVPVICREDSRRIVHGILLIEQTVFAPLDREAELIGNITA